MFGKGRIPDELPKPKPALLTKQENVFFVQLIQEIATKARGDYLPLEEAVVLSVEIAQEYIALNPTKETEKQLNALRRKFRGFYARAQKVAKSILEKWTALDWKTKQLATSLYYFVRLSDTPIWNIAGSLVSHFKLWLEENKKDIDLLLPKFSSLMNEYRVGESDILEE